ncbi:MAG: hypothetical protein FH749_02625 [Firmicutes bacterium]|nr:hypothetical protein [Bacillota bacterium]
MQFIPFSKEYLPHIIRLLEPGVENVDNLLPFYSEQFAAYSGPGDACLLLKSEEQLLVCVHLIAGGEGRYILRLGKADDLDESYWHNVWHQCCATIGELVSAPVTVQTLIEAESPLAGKLNEIGFSQVRELVEMSYSLDKLPATTTQMEGFSMVSLKQAPELAPKWIELFNQGMSGVYGIPPWDHAQFERRRQAPGFKPERWQLGYSNGQPLVALYHEPRDVEIGDARLYLTTINRSKSFTRKVLYDVLAVLKEQQLSQVNMLFDTQNQATNLMFKLAGFEPRRKYYLLEAAATASQAAATSDTDADLPEIDGFYGRSFHNFSSQKK